MKNVFGRLFYGVLLAAALPACTTLNIELPAVTDVATNQRQAGKIIWHDLLTTDIDASRDFYAGLFGWEFEELPLSFGIGRSSKYLLIRHEGRLIGGMLDTRRAGDRVNNSQWVSVMSVDDIDVAAANVTAAGGTVVTPPTDLAERGRIAVVRDSSGALFAMLQTVYGDPLDNPPRVGEFLWDELWTDDIDKATDFYQAIAPFAPVTREGTASNYQGLAVNGRPRFGLLREPVEGLDPTWAPYIRVRDMALLERVAALGGSVAIPATPRELGGEAALIIGPSGAGVAVQTWTTKEAL